MRSACWPSARNFCARGVPDFRKFANFSRAFRAKYASSRRWIRALSCIRTHADSEKELQRRSAVRATTLAEFTQLFCARRAEIFRGLCNSFARVGRKICVIPTLDAFLFQSQCNADSINSQRRCEVTMRSARPSARNFCARSVPDFRNFCKFFARILRKICAISTLSSRLILH